MNRPRGFSRPRLAAHCWGDIIANRTSILARLRAGLLALCGLTLFSHAAWSADVVRRQLEPGVIAIVKHGRNLGLEVRPSSRSSARALLTKYLSYGKDAGVYEGKGSAFVPFDRLNAESQRKILLTIYSTDVVDDRGWAHTVIDDRETLWSLCEWVTGRGTNYREVMADPRNNLHSTPLKAGQRIFIPRNLLSQVMARPNLGPALKAELEPLDYARELKYGSDARGPYAMYRLKQGEALYTAVVVRFTDIRGNAAIREATQTIAARSGISDMRNIDADQEIYIPQSMLSDRYLPHGTSRRTDYEATILEAKRLRAKRIPSKDLSDVVVILDPGHGGTDSGASHPKSGLYEDEINYDLVCRIRELLLKETAARVYVTVRDRSMGYKVVNRSSFRHDEDEELTTHPPYRNDRNATISANLRWMLVNSIYDKERKRGIDSTKIIFTSIHTDSLYDERLRGAMIYIPGANGRRGEEIRNDAIYARYEEGRKFNRFVSNADELRRDEALSRNFASALLEQLGRRRIKRHDQGDPIRTQIRRGNGQSFVPAVLRNTKVPTKILLETANLKNGTDRKRLSDPWWRQQVAQAYVDTLKSYFGATKRTSVAWAD